MSTDAEYYAVRERQERALAAGAADPRIAAIHLVMAESYGACASLDGGSAVDGWPIAAERREAVMPVG